MSTQNLLVLKEVVERHKGKSVNLQQFVACMKLLLGERANSTPNIDAELVDLFSRINIKGQPSVTFNDISTFLMALSNDVRNNKYSFQYRESPQEDITVHHNYIEKVSYVNSRDEIIFYEQGMKTVRVYNPATLQKKREHMVNGTILCLEYIDTHNLIAVSLSNRTLVFIESDDYHKKDKSAQRKIQCPDSTITMLYLARRGYLFTGGLTGAIYCWDIKLLAGPMYSKYDPMQSSGYTLFLVGGFPWFQTHEINLIIDIPIGDQLAVGYSDGGIRIWSLKNDENLRKDVKEPKQKLFGHSKSIKQLAYSDRYKMLLSAGFEFDIYVWNLNKSDPIEKLAGHENSIVGLCCPTGTFNGISCDLKGVIRIWDLRDFTCSQILYVSGVLQVTGLIAIPKHRKLLAYCIFPTLANQKKARKFHAYEYEKPFSPEFSSDSAITALAFSEIRLEIYVGGCIFRV